MPAKALATAKPRKLNTTELARLRPWLQAFDLGATYTPEMIKKQIQAVYDNNLDSGWYLWNPSNVYNQNALLKE